MNAPQTFVLVHGAWHGGWCWRRVAEALRAAGHVVFTPTLTGLGERVHLLRADLTIEDFATDVANVIEAEELGDVVVRNGDRSNNRWQRTLLLQFFDLRSNGLRTRSRSCDRLRRRCRPAVGRSR